MITDYSTVESGDNAVLATTKKKRLSLSATRMSFSSGSQKSSDPPRLFKISYQLSVKVKTGGDVFETKLFIFFLLRSRSYGN